MKRAATWARATLVALVLAGLLYALHTPMAGVPPLGKLLDPADGLYRTARLSAPVVPEALDLPGLDERVEVFLDDRGVPHIFASNDLDAVRAFGYIVARDRLFQIDFISRVASGRLASLLGPAAVETDRFLRNTGMEIGARQNVERIEREDDVEADLIEAFCGGVNVHIDSLHERDLPLEFRLLGVRPDRCDALQVTRLMQYMTFDLTFRSDEAVYGELRRRLSEEDYQLLYPRHSRLFVPIIPDEGDGTSGAASRHAATNSEGGPAGVISSMRGPQRWIVADGFREGKGSNNWAVAGSRSETGAPILAGDMHLSLTLPAVWYEVHIVTPEMNTYGVAIPGAPLPVEAFNDQIGWTFTNTGADQIDHYSLTLDSTRIRYFFEGAWRDLKVVVDTIDVNGGEPVADTLYHSHWGPVFMDEHEPIAIQWVAHEQSRTLEALYHMNRARDYASFEEGLRLWDAPMQNILYAGTDETISIRSTGHLPIRRNGDGSGLLDGSTREGEWVGRVPFDELPHSINPERGYLTSTNQQPAGERYPHYLGHDWRDSYRSLRIDSLMRKKETHSAEDLMRYQADVVAVQRDLFVPLLEPLVGLTESADSLRRMLTEWNGDTGVDQAEPLILDIFLDELSDVVWDEVVFHDVSKPSETTTYYLLTERPDSKWLNVIETPGVEHGQDVLRIALEHTVQVLEDEYGWDAEAWRWGDHHEVVFMHLTQTDAIEGLWRGPFEYPGFRATLSPAGDRLTTHSASWRVVVDYSTSPPVARGVYPGGQSGNPLSPLYASHLSTYLSFENYPLLNQADRAAYEADRSMAKFTFSPSASDLD